ncbi:MAG: hypothetical protein ICV87_02570 [Gemmatimonadetes bacterium]|nr:hypothetical protein [Gemmatimonadota bacterium]
MAINDPTITTEAKQGHTTGTVIARVTDGSGVVREVNFYKRLEGDAAPGVGPFPADIVRRPASNVGVYEFDVVRDRTARTVVGVQLVLEDTSVKLGTERIFDARNADAAVGVGGEMRVQDSSTGPTAASTLTFQGAVVSVENAVASLNLDGRYVTHGGAAAVLATYDTRAVSDSRYAQLSGAAFTGDVSVAGGRAVLGVDAFNGNAKLELGSSAAGGTVPYIDFHYGVGAEQDFNARLMNDANNLLTLAFAGAGTLNVQGTIQQNGTALSLAGHTHDDRFAQLGHTHAYLGLGGGTLWGTLAGTVFQTSGGAGAFQVGDRGGLNPWAMYASGNALRWWYAGTSSDRVTLDGATGSLSVAGSVSAPVVNVTGSNGWMTIADRTGAHGYTLYNTSSILRFHSHRDGVDRMTLDQAGNMGLGGALTLAGASGYALLLGGGRNPAYSQVTTTPNLHLDCTDGWQTYLNYYSNRPVNIGQIDQNAYMLCVNGWMSSRGGGTNEHGSALLSNQNDWGGGANYPTIGGTGSGNKGLIMLLRPHVPRIAGSDGAYVRMATDPAVTAIWDMGTFGDEWAVRRGGAGALLRIGSDGTLSDKHGHHIASVVFGSGPPDASTPGAVGTLYIY